MVSYKKRFVVLLAKLRQKAPHVSETQTTASHGLEQIHLVSKRITSEMSTPVRDSTRLASGVWTPTVAPNESRVGSDSQADPANSSREDLQSPIAHVAERILATLPNDLARLVYLASIRDNNTGTYLHPQLSRLFDVKIADQLLRLSHERVFRKILATSVRQCVAQMERYIQFSGVDQSQVIATWKSIQAYRATVPANADELSVKVFALNIDTALLVLQEMLSRSSTESHAPPGDRDS